MGWTFYNSNGEALVQHAESEATKAEMEAETAGAKFVPPDLVKNSPGVAKVWCHIADPGTLSTPDYGVSSITDTGAGDRTIVFSTAFSSVIYAPVATIETGATSNPTCHFATLATGSVQHTIISGSGSAEDRVTSVAIYGDH